MIRLRIQYSLLISIKVTTIKFVNTNSLLHFGNTEVTITIISNIIMSHDKCKVSKDFSLKKLELTTVLLRSSSHEIRTRIVFVWFRYSLCVADRNRKHHHGDNTIPNRIFKQTQNKFNVVIRIRILLYGSVQMANTLKKKKTKSFRIFENYRRKNRLATLQQWATH